jgi:hypothetical protein
VTIDPYASAGRGVIVGVGVRVGVGIGIGATVGGSDCAVTGIEEGLLFAPPQPNRDSINTIASIGKTRVTRINSIHIYAHVMPKRKKENADKVEASLLGK